MKREYDDIRLRAAFRGVDLEGKMKEKKKEEQGMFKAPEEYSDMSEQEKQEMTERMMAQHRARLSGDNK